MSIFITLLAFNDPAFISAAKISIIFASVSACLLGLGTLWLVLRK
jgi:Na+/H+ antiporter NhaA